ncbi:MAG: hypothetical protein EXS08_03375 [Planctomycetes bacterium]|nr:hypothetical protein [Planctomycetota bacterium]
MGKLRSSFALVSTLLALAPTPASAGELEVPSLTRAPVVFAVNAGQCSSEVRFQARSAGLVVSVLADGLHLELGGAALQLRFHGASTTRAEGLEPRAARAHFLGGARATHDVATFGRVRLVGLYRGVDLELYERDGRLEYDLLLAPGAELEAVALEVEGADALALDESGSLVATLSGRSFRQRAPVAWQTLPDGTRRALACAWQRRADGCFGFALERAAPGAAVMIDPVLEYESFVGGSNADEARDVFVDEQGSVYITGWARSVDFPGAQTPPATRGKECVVFKLAPNGKELVYATYLGGRGDDIGTAIQVNRAGQVFVAGTTQSADFPTSSNAYDARLGGGTDGFLLALTADGATLTFATLLGGSLDDTVTGLELASGGEPTLAGTTRSRDFPVSAGSYGTEARGGRDAFVARFDPHGERLVFSTRVGGSADDEANALALDAEGCVYLTGSTQSSDFPTTLAALDREHCGVDGFVTKLSAGGRSLLYSTFLGGTGQDACADLAVDAEGRAVVVGWTQSLDFPFDAGRKAPGRKDGFAVRLSSTGNALSYATPLGGGSADEARGVCLDALGAAWIVGCTRSEDLPLSADARNRRMAGAADAFLVELSAESGAALYATFLGGEGEDELCRVHMDRSGSALSLCGFATGIPLRQRGALTGKRCGPADAFVLCFDPRGTHPLTPADGLEAGLGLGF